jgi:pilus assembly protein Flp/PilA
LATYLQELFNTLAVHNAFFAPEREGHPGASQMSKIVAFLKNESGATAIEYGLIAAGISVAIIAAVNTIGVNLNTTFSSVSTQLK